MERLNLNIPEDAKRYIRLLAKQERRTESEVARELLLEALKERRRREFYEKAAKAASNPQHRERALRIARVMETLRGEKR
jgi:hypothetical protein